MGLFRFTIKTVVLVSMPILIIIGFVIYQTILRTYEPPNANLRDISFSKPAFKIFYKAPDKDGVNKLYSISLSGTDKKLLYEHSSGFRHILYQSKRQIIIVQSDAIILLDDNGKFLKELYKAPQSKYIAQDNAQKTINEQSLVISLYDENDYRVTPIIHEIQLDSGSDRVLESFKFTGSHNVLQAPNLGLVAQIQKGSVFVDDKELIHWPNYEYKFNPGCYNLWWLPFGKYLIVSCNDSMRVVDVMTGRHAELDKGYGFTWYNN